VCEESRQVSQQVRLLAPGQSAGFGRMFVRRTAPTCHAHLHAASLVPTLARGPLGLASDGRWAVLGGVGGEERRLGACQGPVRGARRAAPRAHHCVSARLRVGGEHEHRHGARIHGNKLCAQWSALFLCENGQGHSGHCPAHAVAAARAPSSPAVAKNSSRPGNAGQSRLNRLSQPGRPGAKAFSSTLAPSSSLAPGVKGEAGEAPRADIVLVRA